MDPIEYFIKSHNKFRTDLLLSAHSNLSSLQLVKGWIGYDDVQQSLYLTVQNQNILNEEIEAHLALIIEGSLIPAVTAKGEIKLQMTRELVGNEYLFLKGLFNVISGKCEINEYPSVEEFRREIAVHSNSRFNKLSRHQIDDQDMRMGADMSMHSMRKPSKVAHHHGMPIVDTDLPSDTKGASSRIDYEKSEPIVRLLAQVRKVGMDILFPQSTHDKILVCIFVAIKSSITPAHRELIDMVMAVRDAGQIGKLDHVSKTKVRGVLALLKHGELLVTQGEEGEPVRLFLARGINSIEDLRVRHDAFITRYMVEHHSFIPVILKSELVWQFKEETKRDRLAVMNEISIKLDGFYKEYIERLLTQSAAQVSNQPRPSNDLMGAHPASGGMGMSGSGDGQGHLHHPNDPYFDGSGAAGYNDMLRRRMDNRNPTGTGSGSIYDVDHHNALEFNSRQGSRHSIQSLQSTGSAAVGTDSERTSLSSDRGGRGYPTWKGRGGPRSRTNSGNTMSPYSSPYLSPYQNLSPRDAPNDYPYAGGRDVNRAPRHYQGEPRMGDPHMGGGGFDQNYIQGGDAYRGGSDRPRGHGDPQLMDNGELSHLNEKDMTHRMRGHIPEADERYDDFQGHVNPGSLRGGNAQVYSSRQPPGSVSGSTFNKGYNGSLGPSGGNNKQYANRPISVPQYDALSDQQRQSRLQRIGAPTASWQQPQQYHQRMYDGGRSAGGTQYNNLTAPTGTASSGAGYSEVSTASSSSSPDSPRGHQDIANNALTTDSSWQFRGLYGSTGGSVSGSANHTDATISSGSLVGIADDGNGSDAPTHIHGSTQRHSNPSQSSSSVSRVPMLNMGVGMGVGNPRKSALDLPLNDTPGLLGLDLLGSGGRDGPDRQPSPRDGYPSPRDGYGQSLNQDAGNGRFRRSNLYQYNSCEAGDGRGMGSGPGPQHPDGFHASGSMEGQGQGPLFNYSLPIQQWEGDKAGASLTSLSSTSGGSGMYTGDKQHGGMDGKDLGMLDSNFDDSTQTVRGDRPMSQRSFNSGSDQGYSDHYDPPFAQPDEQSTYISSPTEQSSQFSTASGDRSQPVKTGLPDDLMGLQRMAMASLPSDTPTPVGALAASWGTVSSIPSVHSITSANSIASLGSDADQVSTSKSIGPPPGVVGTETHQFGDRLAPGPAQAPASAVLLSDACESSERRDRVDSLSNPLSIN